MQQTNERDLRKTATEIRAEGVARQDRLDRDALLTKEDLAVIVEARLVSAAWTLRRMPDKERGFLRLRSAVWPDMAPDAARYPAAPMSHFNARRRMRISPQEIDQMQPALDLLTLLPDVLDRQILFWTAWHQDGEVQTRIPWAKVRRSLDVTASRWTLKRRYQARLEWLAALILLQQ